MALEKMTVLDTAETKHRKAQAIEQRFHDLRLAEKARDVAAMKAIEAELAAVGVEYRFEAGRYLWSVAL